MNQTGIFRQLEQRAEGETPDRSPVRHRTLTLFKQHTHTYRQSDKPTVHVLACGSKPEQHRAHAGTGKTTQLKSNTQPSSYEAHFHQWCLFFFLTTLSNAAVDVFVKQKNLRFPSVRSEGKPQRNLLSHLHVCKLAIIFILPSPMLHEPLSWPDVAHTPHRSDQRPSSITPALVCCFH